MLQAVAAVLFVMLVTAPAMALEADMAAIEKPSLFRKLSTTAGEAMYQGRKMLHCCGASNHEPWDFGSLVRSTLELKSA